MRALGIGALAAVVFAATSPAQTSDTSRAATRELDGRLRAEIAVLSRLLWGVRMPSADTFQLGNQQIGSGASYSGTVAVARGDLDVHGTVQGDAMVLHGDLVIHPGARITGNATAIDGRVRTLGGVVDGDVRTVRGITGGILARAAGRAASSEPLTTWSAIKLVLGWFAVLFAIGIGVMLFAERNLDGVVNALEQQFARAFWTGVLTELAAIPALLLLVIGLAITLIGILLIPFAIVAYVVAYAGLLTLGFLAVARLTGRAFFRGGGASRAVNLRALLAGLVVYLGLWFLAAVFGWNPVIGSVLRAVALAGSWVALTLGLGAAITSRAGTREEGQGPPRVVPADDLSWQTPTPVTGVVAARRPVVAGKDR